MTREDKIKALEREREYMISHGGDSQAKALADAIELMRREPCEDAVSRKQVVEWLQRASDDSIQHAIDSNMEFISSVTPTRKKGRWIYTPQKRLVDETDEGPVYEVQEKCSCSACGADFGYCKVDDNYCKYCGAEMGGSKECE